MSLSRRLDSLEAQSRQPRGEHPRRRRAVCMLADVQLALIAEGVPWEDVTAEGWRARYAARVRQDISGHRYEENRYEEDLPKP